DRAASSSLACACAGFFFSSGRRHTRFSRDWSSDVCSSDLGPAQLLAGARGDVQGHDLVEVLRRTLAQLLDRLLPGAEELLLGHCALPRVRGGKLALQLLAQGRLDPLRHGSGLALARGAAAALAGLA